MKERRMVATLLHFILSMHNPNVGVPRRTLLDYYALYWAELDSSNHQYIFQINDTNKKFINYEHKQIYIELGLSGWKWELVGPRRWLVSY